MQRKKPLTRQGKHWIAIILTWVGGFVDVVAYMTGNSVHIGQFAVDVNRHEFIAPAIAVLAYVSGLIIARILIEIGARHHVASVATWTLLIEFLLLLIAVPVGTPFLRDGHVPSHSEIRYLLTAVLAFAMGTQTVTLTKVGPLTVYTTFVTGTLTKFAQRFSVWIFRVYDEREVSARGLVRDKDFRDSAFLAFIWISYVGGAAAGAILKKRLELSALLIPCFLLLPIMLLDQVRPMSLEEERE